MPVFNTRRLSCWIHFLHTHHCVEPLDLYLFVYWKTLRTLGLHSLRSWPLLLLHALNKSNAFVHLVLCSCPGSVGQIARQSGYYVPDSMSRLKGIGGKVPETRLSIISSTLIHRNTVLLQGHEQRWTFDGKPETERKSLIDRSVEGCCEISIEHLCLQSLSHL